MIRRIVITAAALVLAACATTQGPSDDTITEPDPQACAADAYQGLVGQQIGEVHTDSLPRPLRVYAVTDMITMDHRPDRMNIVVSVEGDVVEVSCG